MSEVSERRGLRLGWQAHCTLEDTESPQGEAGHNSAER